MLPVDLNPLATSATSVPSGQEPLTGSAFFTEASVDSWLAAGLVVGAALYLYGVYRLRLRGDHWPALRTFCFLVLGFGSVAVVTLSGLHAYDTSVISVHMIQHMVLSMVAPIFLALGAPVTLALRLLPKRPKSLLLAVLHSRFAKVVTHPLYAYAIFVINPFVLYFTGLYRLSWRTRSSTSWSTCTSWRPAACSSGRCSAWTRCRTAGRTRAARC